MKGAGTQEGEATEPRLSKTQSHWQLQGEEGAFTRDF